MPAPKERKQPTYRCQFCTAESPTKEWKAKNDHCPKCGRAYDALLAQDEDDS